MKACSDNIGTGFLKFIGMQNLQADRFIVQLPNREIKSIISNPEKSAQAVNLIYVHDSEKGIERIKKGKHFIYINSGCLKMSIF